MKKIAKKPEGEGRLEELEWWVLYRVKKYIRS